MNTNTQTHYKGFTYQPIIKISNEILDGSDSWYEYLIEGHKGKRKCLIKGGGIYKTPESASKAADTFAKKQIDEHLYKYKNSFLYKPVCIVGYCPASKFQQPDQN